VAAIHVSAPASAMVTVLATTVSVRKNWNRPPIAFIDAAVGSVSVMLPAAALTTITPASSTVSAPVAETAVTLPEANVIIASVF
jgi:hypothetical protein